MEGAEGRSSALPRLSKLPHLPRPNRTSSIVGYGGTSTAGAVEHGTLPSRPQRNSMVLGNTSPSKIANPLSPTKNKRQSMLLQPGFKVANSAPEPQEEESIDTILSPPPDTIPEANGYTSPTEEANTAKIRKPRSSLSDRTVETLSQVPPSPSPSKRRQSGFYTTESPMRPPSRATSALGNIRPPSQMSAYSTARAHEPPSPSKRITSAQERKQSTSMSSMRAVSSYTIRDPGTSLKSPTFPSRQTTRIQPPSGGIPKPATNNITSMIASKTMTARPSKPRSPVKDAFGETTIKPIGRTLSTPRSIKPTGTLGPKKRIPNGLNKPAPAKKSPIPLPEEIHEENTLEDSKTLNSSQSFRAAIAQAKAARRSTSGPKAEAFLPRSVGDEYSGLANDADPAALDLLDSSHVNIIRKRINNAKSDGKLNISALCLQELPIEVLKMYDPGSQGEGGPAWYEAVDITKLNAADNELTELPETVFPETSSRAWDVNAEDDSPPAIFAGLEAIDFRGNQLRNLPSGLGRLSVLTSLNLSRNLLSTTSLDTICYVTSIRELRLSENQFKGLLPDCIGRLESLELLDLRGNSLTEISPSLGKLPKLRYLDVSSNQLIALPMEAIFDLPITEILASRNKLSGTLLPSNIPQVPFLQKLDLSTNALTAISETKVDFLQLQSLNVSNNRISALPNMTGWQSLTFLNVEENKISEIPVGFSSLQSLKHADFGNNSLLELDETIGSMDNLAVFNIQNNPMRERRLPKLTTEELKAELKGRTALLYSPGSDRSGSATIGSFARAMSWTVSGDILDRANARLRTVEKMDLEPIVHENIRSCILHHNQLQVIPSSLEIIGSTLTSLDLANNKLGKATSFLAQPTHLLNLQSLNLTSNALTTLEPLVANLRAPKLATLIVLFNRLTFLPASPTLTNSFPSLTKLMASNNQITTLDVEAVRGLQVLDVSSNEIAELPPRLALLEGTLRTLIVNGNRFRVPGWGVLEKGTEEILKWCRMKIPKGEEGAMEAEW